jgi:DNA-binding transcriptional ArsR family regulator
VTAYEEVLTALGDPTRRRILELLQASPRPVGELARELPVSRPAVSQHLKVLADARLVEARAAGTRRVYQVRPEGLEPLRVYLDRFWGDALAAFHDYATRKNDPAREAPTNKVEEKQK